MVWAASPSLTASSSTLRAIPVGAASSSMRVAVALVTVSEPDEPETVTVSFVSSRLLSVGSRLKVPVAVLAPTGMVMSKSSTEANGTRPAWPDPATLTVTVFSTPKVVVPCTLAVTVISWVAAFSRNDVWLRESAMVVGVSSSSVTVTVPELTVKPVSVPVKVTVASVSSTVSSTGIRVTVWVPESPAAGMVMVKAVMAPMSTVPAVRAPVTFTVLDAPNRVEPSTVAFTTTLRAVPEASSAMVPGATVNVTEVGGSSSSVTVTSTLPIVSSWYLGSVDDDVWVTVAVRLSFGLSILSGWP